MNDLNLAGLATIAGLILFFPSVGLFERRRAAAAARRADREHRRAYNNLMVEVATEIVKETRHDAEHESAS